MPNVLDSFYFAEVFLNIVDNRNKAVADPGLPEVGQ